MSIVDLIFHKGGIPMKALTIYSKGEIHLRQLLRKLQDYGKLNCDFETFSKLYEE